MADRAGGYTGYRFSAMPVARSFLDPMTRCASWCLAGVLVVALGLRLWGINFGLPYVEHPDEPFWVVQVLKMVKTGDPNPHDFIYPSLYYYINAFGYLVYYGIGRLFGVFGSLADLAEPVLLIGGSGKTTLPMLFLGGRCFSAVLGVATVALTFDLARRITHSTFGGVLAGLWAALSPTLVANSRFLIPDGPLAFFTTLVTWAAWRVCQEGRTRHYILAGAALGLAAGTKYNAAVFALAIVLAHFLRSGWRGIKDWRLYAAGVVSLILFVATTPFAVLDYQTFLKGALIDVRHYTGGHAGNAGNSLAWYLSFFWRTEGPMLLLAAAGIIWGIFRRSRGALLIAITSLSYLLFISAFAVHFERTALPLLPLFAVLAAYWLVSLLPSRASGYTGIQLNAAAALLVVALIFPLVGTVRDTVRLMQPDSLDTAREWIEHNLPAGSRIGIESYSPWIDPQKFVVQGFYKLNDHPAEWYVTEGYDYLVFSETMFRRFYADPVQFASAIARYETFFSTFEEVQVFTDGGYEVRIYRLPDGK